MEFSWDQILTAFMVLFAVIDIVGSIPLIIELKRKSGDVNPLKTTVVSSCILLGFLIVGESILDVIGIDVKSFSVAGSIILFFISLEMILGITLFKDDEASSKIASIVPLSFPIIAGAGTMTTLVSLRAEYSMANIAVAIILNMAVVFVVLKLSKRIERMLGPNGLAVMRKVFGVILLSIAVKLFGANAKTLFL
jgi:multiple antibiotic resistance protein